MGERDVQPVVNKRLIAGAAALILVVALVGLALVAGRDDGGPPRKLPVLGAGAERAGANSAMPADLRIRPTTYVVDAKLPGLDDQADAWTLEPGTADVAAVAKVLGVDASTVHAEDQAGSPWSMYQEVTTGVGQACASDTPCEVPEPQRPAGLPGRDEAERIGRRLLGELGVDLDHAAVRVEDGFSQWNVSADPEVGGLPTIGMTTMVGIGPGGKVTYANGWQGEPARGDRYPLIGTAAGVRRLQDQQVRPLGGGIAEQRAAPDCLACPAPEVLTVRITGARLGLELFGGYESGTPGYLVPAYLFTTDQDGWGEMTVVAVADEYLGRPPVSEPAPTEPAPTEPTTPGGDRSCSANGSSGGSATDGPSVQVCGPNTATVGETITFELTAKGNVRDDCASPDVEWGDGSDHAVCAIACASLPAEPKGLDRTFEHAYAKPGTYSVTFTLQGCGDGAKPQATVQTEVRVTA